jgi:hypothetical protein
LWLQNEHHFYLETKIMTIVLRIGVAVLIAMSITRASDAVDGVKGTYWASQTDAGGCSMPTASYTVQHALALGDMDALGDLKISNAMCGQVLSVNCGGETVEAVVASTCNIGSGTCGVDLITKTWNATTGNAPFGISKCNVRAAPRLISRGL